MEFMQLMVHYTEKHKTSLMALKSFSLIKSSVIIWKNALLKLFSILKQAFGNYRKRMISYHLLIHLKYLLT